MKKRITSSDVAREAGVSRTTVSLVLNNVKGVRISDNTRKKVLDAAETLGYYFDLNAQALKTNRSMSIGVVTSRANIADERFALVFNGIRQILADKQYSIVLCSGESAQSKKPDYYRLYYNKRIDGVIFISYQEQLDEQDSKKLAKQMISEQIPCVFADYHIDDEIANCVDIDYYHGAYLSARYLIENGHKKIALLISDYDIKQEKERLQGVRQAIQESKDIELLTYNAGTAPFSEDIIKTLLQDKSKYSALIVARGRIAARTLYYANKMKIKVPEEIALISLAGESIARYTCPNMSTCKLPLYELGEKSAQVLMDCMHESKAPVNVKLPCALKIRESC